MEIITVIPSRMASQRLPDKPLAMIGDKSMIAHVVDSACTANLGHIVLAVAEDEIGYAVAKRRNVLVVKTDPSLPSGSDRVYQAIEKSGLSYSDNTIILNLQGDMPFCPADFLAKACKILEKHPEYDLATLVAPITREEVDIASKVKVATSLLPADVEKDKAATALYFSRSVIPHGQTHYWGHVGLYAWRIAALKRFVESKQGVLEKVEKLEQLRALELGMKIGCAAVSYFPLSVDTQRDLEKAQDFYKNR